MLFRILLLFYWFCCLPAFAQEGDSKKALNPFLVFDNYYSFIGNKSADVWGFRAGIEWNQTWRFGAGYNKIRSDIVERKILSGEELSYASNDTVKAQLFLTYFPVMAEYIFYRSDPWIISLPLQAGYGKSYFQYFDRDNDERKIFKRGVVVTQAGISAQYKIIRWVGVGAGLGYRLMLVNNPEIETKMNSPVFAIGIKLYLGEIVKSIQGNESE
jgi:hypothetical protein